jgi:glucosamine-6-phosphate deaminase
MNVIVCDSYEDMSKKAAELTAQMLETKPNGLVSFPGGDTPAGMVKDFVSMVNDGIVDISHANFTMLDEWVGLSVKDEGSCAKFVQDNLIDQLEKPFAHIHMVDGSDNPENQIAALDHFIESYGPLSVSVLGIGLNGHLGFNESGVSPNKNAHMIPLDDVTKNVMHKYFPEDVNPEYGLTQGLNQILQAEMVILIANGAHKAEIIKKAVSGEVTTSVPASILQRHTNCYVVVDQEAAKLL